MGREAGPALLAPPGRALRPGPEQVVGRSLAGQVGVGAGVPLS